MNPLAPAVPDRLSETSEQQGFRGVRLGPAADEMGDRIRGPLMMPLWRHRQSLTVPMTLLAPISRVSDIGLLMEKFPDLKVVIDHVADSPVDHPRELEKLVALVRYPKVFVKVSHTWSLSKQSYPWLDAQRLVKRLYNTFGPRRLKGNQLAHCKRACYLCRTLVRVATPFLNAEDKEWMFSRSTTVERDWPFLNHHPEEGQ